MTPILESGTFNMFQKMFNHLVLSRGMVKVISDIEQITYISLMVNTEKGGGIWNWA